ncbi:adenylate/guanylate cyclase domain-containing protein [Phaeobacter sp. QD34_3]|uniref:adenylate/guanylate cyclase domain-containing protein n=1 Tax=unclassified Phaeobacter TaxID=2621772 RepID=UPI00237EF7A9|nr:MULTISPECIES: adenylate/guanylate cyclase domain-containing protein [unclassified Phaeobacter]MDE4132613.1 adenylate/guanylate cyclase domain-containing protein [Phaeobacter sp. QD34_3]MDE4136249.1 adenylate/guanylate cyclase domain-containing protein [Phaeobacter sp. QD34_24]
MSNPVTRKLTTILAADAERYSAAMEADEVATYAALKAARAVFFKLIDRHGGRVANTAGDGLIADFPSVVEATHCAIEVQQELAAEHSLLRFRIGIHLGDVICDGDDLLGDGVNLASRLQTMAEPGGILISRQVYDQVHNKLTIGFEYLGEKSAKNLPEEVSVYRITTAAATADRFEKVKPQVRPAQANKPDRPARPEKVAHVWDGDRTDQGAQPAPTAPSEGRSAAQSALQAAKEAFGGLKTPTQRLYLFGVGGAVLLNLVTGGRFWPAWPVLALALVYGQINGNGALGFKPFLSIPVRIWILALFLICINLMTTAFPWAIFPVAALVLGGRVMGGRGEPGAEPEEQA